MNWDGGMKFSLFIGARFPSKEDFKNTSVARSVKRQGERHDEFWTRAALKEYQSGISPYSDIYERIRGDEAFRRKLALKVVKACSNFAPGQILMSKVCRMAYTVGIEKGEFTYENAGYRNRRAE